METSGIDKESRYVINYLIIFHLIPFMEYQTTWKRSIQFFFIPRMHDKNTVKVIRMTTN